MKDIWQFLQVKPVKGFQHVSFDMFSFHFFRKSEEKHHLSFGSILLLSSLTVIPYILATEIILFRKQRYFIKLKRRVVGILALHETTEALYISSLAVSSEYRRLRIATYILNYVLQVAKRLNKKYLELSVFKTNIPALRLYKKNGFVKKKEKKFSLILRKEIA